MKKIGLFLLGINVFIEREEMAMEPRDLRKLSITFVFMCFFLCVAIPASGTSVNISGSYIPQTTINIPLVGPITIPTVGVSDQFGTSSGSNPYIGLNFQAGGQLTYSYDLNYDLSLSGPATVYSGETIHFAPQFNFDSGSLTANQNLGFSTGFDLKLEMPWLIPDIDVSNFSIPNLSFSDAYITTEGSGSINNSSSNATLLGDGLVKIETANNSMPAWETGADIISILGQTSIPYVGQAMLAADLVGFDLTTSIGMDIYRTDTLILGDWNVHLLPTNVIGLNIGQMFTYSIDTTLDYSLYLVSDYQYGGSGALTFDGPGFNPITLANFNIGDPWDVGRIVTQLDYSVPVSLTYQAEVVSRGDWIGSHLEPFAPVYHPPFDFSRVLASTPLSSNHPDLQPVPEPSTLFLLGSGLLGLVGLNRRRKA